MIDELVCTNLKEGLLLVNKPEGKTSFSLIRALRKLTGIAKIGHAGTLDPFATGVMVLLIGKQFTKLSDQLLSADKEYLAELWLGVTTDSYDCDGKIVGSSKRKPHLETLEKVLEKFQGSIEQIPPMFSAKKIQGQKLYELARQGKTVERSAAKVDVSTQLLDYQYPKVILKISCSKGTYIRSLAHDIGEQLGCGAHLTKLQRTRSGQFRLDSCIDGNLLFNDPCFDITPYLMALGDFPLTTVSV
ncbi:MAG: tRNA pseudouridine(55) synthase TruB [Verrucomicrobia bacterium]|nr:tRNA pseudouridine(55) synthase TruB [Verrucomicrobiota bacterium]MBS0647245.1 tRNA pseudouridine(55) synthase TruB [Verrucomicrobiota bacterium]